MRPLGEECLGLVNCNRLTHCTLLRTRTKTGRGVGNLSPPRSALVRCLSLPAPCPTLPQLYLWPFSFPISLQVRRCCHRGGLGQWDTHTTFLVLQWREPLQTPNGDRSLHQGPVGPGSPQKSLGLTIPEIIYTVWQSERVSNKILMPVKFIALIVHCEATTEQI